MKIKCRPDDFQVHELTDLGPTDGPFALYELRKESLGTLEAAGAIARRWQVPASRISFGGLKDRYATTTQWLTIEHGPRRNLQQSHLALIYRGQTPRAYGSEDIAGNRFRLVVRDVPPATSAWMCAALPDIAAEGVPNYFDRQRFGSRGRSGEYVAKPWCQGDFERALWLALADPNRHDRPGQRADKQALREHWGDWSACHDRLRDPDLRELARFLAQYPRDYRRAFVRIDVHVRRLFLAAFQSHAWNLLLARSLEDACQSESLARLEIDGEQLPFLLRGGDWNRGELRSSMLPLPSARLHLADDDPLRRTLDDVLSGLGLPLREMRVKYPRDSFFSKGLRPALFAPTNCAAAADADELHPAQHKVVFEFQLPRGAYATILLKAIALRADESLGDAEE